MTPIRTLRWTDCDIVPPAASYPAAIIGGMLVRFLHQNCEFFVLLPIAITESASIRRVFVTVDAKGQATLVEGWAS